MAGKAFDFGIVGAEEIEAALDALPRNISASILRRVGAKALVPTKEAATRYATSNLRTGEGRRYSKKRGEYFVRPFRLSYIISTRLKRGQPKADRSKVSVYVGSTDALAHLLEFGHQVRNREGGPVVGFAAPHPTLRPAWDETQPQVLALVKANLWTEILKATRSLRKRAEKLGAKLGL